MVLSNETATYAPCDCHGEPPLLVKGNHLGKCVINRTSILDSLCPQQLHDQLSFFFLTLNDFLTLSHTSGAQGLLLAAQESLRGTYMGLGIEPESFLCETSN